MKVNCYDSNGQFTLTKEFFTKSNLTQFKKIVDLIIRDWTVTDDDKKIAFYTIKDILDSEYQIEFMRDHKSKMAGIVKKLNYIKMKAGEIK